MSKPIHWSWHPLNQVSNAISGGRILAVSDPTGHWYVLDEEGNSVQSGSEESEDVRRVKILEILEV